MKKMWLAGVALGASLAFGGTASAQDISIGVAGPMTGQYASFGTQLKNGAEAAVADINAAGGVMGKKLKLEVGDDACDPKQARAVGREVRQRQAAVRRRALLLVVVDPGVGGLPGRRRAADHAGLDQSDLHRPQHVEHVPRLRPRRPAGHGRRRLRRQELQGQERRHPSGQVDLRQRSGRRDEEGAEQGRREGEDVRGLHAGRQGLQFAGLEDEGQQDRRGLCRRLPHRGRPDSTPNARPGHDKPDDLRRRDCHQRVLVDHRRRPAKA